MVKRATLTEEERGRIAEAIRDAESRTSGEIYCVLARASDSYFFPAMFTLTVVLLAIGMAAAFFLHNSWMALSLPQFVAAQALAFICAALLLRFIPALRPRLVPKHLQYRRAHDNAVRQFLGHNIHLTAERTGVLVFVSLAERYAEIVADTGIDSRVEQREWDTAVDLLIAAARDGRVADGFLEAIANAGRLLGEHFPGKAGDRNELADHVAEI